MTRIIQCPFNAALGRKAQIVYYKDSTLANRKRMRYFVIGAIVASSYGCYKLMNREHGSYIPDILLFALGIHYLIVSINYFWQLNKNQEKLNLILQERNSRLEGTSITMEFSETGFRHKEEGYAFYFNWEFVTGYRILEEVLIIETRLGTVPAYLIPSKVITEDDFEFVLRFLAEKIPSSGENSNQKHENHPDLLDN